MSIITFYNGPMPTTAPIAKVAGPTSGSKTMQQILASATKGFEIVAWGFSCDIFALAQPIQAELINTGAVAATVTAYALADLMLVDGAARLDGNLTTNVIQIGTTSSGYTASGEGSAPSAVEVYDYLNQTPMSPYVREFGDGRLPLVKPAEIVRVRLTNPGAGAFNVTTWITIKV